MRGVVRQVLEQCRKPRRHGRRPTEPTDNGLTKGVADILLVDSLAGQPSESHGERQSEQAATDQAGSRKQLGLDGKRHRWDDRRLDNFAGNLDVGGLLELSLTRQHLRLLGTKRLQIALDLPIAVKGRVEALTGFIQRDLGDTGWRSKSEIGRIDDLRVRCPLLLQLDDVGFDLGQLLGERCNSRALLLGRTRLQVGDVGVDVSVGNRGGLLGIGQGNAHRHEIAAGLMRHRDRTGHTVRGLARILGCNLLSNERTLQHAELTEDIAVGVTQKDRSTQRILGWLDVHQCSGLIGRNLLAVGEIAPDGAENR